MCMMFVSPLSHRNDNVDHLLCEHAGFSTKSHEDRLMFILRILVCSMSTLVENESSLLPGFCNGFAMQLA